MPRTARAPFSISCRVVRPLGSGLDAHVAHEQGLQAYASNSAIEGLGCTVNGMGLRFRVWGLGFGVEGLGFKV